MISVERKVDYRKLAAAMGTSRRKISMVSPEEALRITGFRVGTIPPLGHLHKLRTFVDAGLVASDTEIYGG